MANVQNPNKDLGRNPTGAERAAAADDATAKGSNFREENRGRESWRQEAPYEARGEADERHWSREVRNRRPESAYRSPARRDDERAAVSLAPGGELIGWERWVTLGGGALLVRWGLRRGGLSGLVGLALGGGMAWAGWNGRVPQPAARLASTREEDRLARERGWSSAAATVATVTIARPAEELYRFWKDVKNLPRIMEHIESIEPVDERRSRWTVKAPAGATVSWESVITEDDRNRRIAWESAPGADVRNYGWIEFTPAPGDRGTEVKALIVYEPPGGQIGRLVAQLFREEPAVQLREDLRRFKQIIETGSAGTAESPHLPM